MLLFVYGTLRPGSPHPFAARLARESRWLGMARARGRLYRVSWYPAYVPGAAGWVSGDLLRLTRPGETLAWLDAFEDVAPSAGPPEYARATVPVLGGIGPRRAQTYRYTLPVKGLTPLPGGDWLA